MDALRVLEALLNWGTLGRLGATTYRAEVRKLRAGVQGEEDIRAWAIARAKREALNKLSRRLERRIAARGGPAAEEAALALSSGLMQPGVVREQPIAGREAQGVRIVVEGRVPARGLDERLRRLLGDPKQLDRLRVSEQRSDTLLARFAELEARNERLAASGTDAEKHALQHDFRENTARLAAQEWYRKSLALWDGKEYRDPERVAEYFTQAIGLVPDYPLYYFLRGNANYFWKQYSLAIRDYDSAIRLNPQYAEAYNNRGNTRSAQGDYRQALRDYERAIGLDAADADYHNNRGNAWYHLDDPARALQDYDRAIALDAGNAIYHNNRGIAHDGRNERSQALEDYGRAVQADPEYAVAYRNRGATYEALEQYREAIRDYDRAIRLEPRNPDAWYGRACGYHKLGNLRAARRDWRKAAKLGHSRAEQALSRHP